MASLLAAALPSLQCMSSTRVSSADAFESHGPTVLSSAALGLTSGSGSGASAALAAASASGSGAGSVKLISVVGEAGNLVSQGIACAHGDGRGGKRAKYMEKHQAEKHFAEKHHTGGISFQIDSAVTPSAPPAPMAPPPDRISAKHAAKPAASGGGSVHVSLDRATAPHASTPGEPVAATLADCRPPYSHIPHCHNEGSGEDQLPPLVSREAVAEASPLGLTLRKTPSLVEFISHRLSEGAGDTTGDAPGDAADDGAGDGSGDMDMIEEARTGVPSGGEGGEPAGPAHTKRGSDAQRTARGMGGGGMNSSSSSSSSEAELDGRGMAQGNSARGNGIRERDEPVRPGSAPAHQRAQDQGRAQGKGIPALVAFGGGATAVDGAFASPDGASALMAEGALASFSAPFPALPAPAADKLKASNFPATRMTIGSWERRSKYEGDLVAKCYFAKRKLVWEVLEGGLKSKIEVQWGDIATLHASTAKGQPGVLEIEVSRPPQFFKEMNPQPRRHTLWQSTPDFTAGQANSFRRHVVEFAEGVLNKHLHKLLASDPRLRDLAHGTSAHHTHPGQHGQGGQGSAHMGMHARTHAHAYGRDVLQSSPHKARVGAMGAMGVVGAGGAMEGVMSYGHGKPTAPHGALPYGSPAALADPLLPLAHAHGPPHARTHGSVYPRSHSHAHSHVHAGADGRGSSVGEEGEVAGRGKARQGAAHVAPPYPMLPAGFFPPPPLPQTFFPPPPIMPPFPTHHLPPPPSTPSSPASAAAAAAVGSRAAAAARAAADPRSPLSAPFPPFPYFPSHLYPPPPYLPGGYMSNSFEGEQEEDEEEEEEEEGNEEGGRVAVERNEKGEWGKGVRGEGDEGEEEKGSGGRCSSGGAAGVGGRGGGEKHGGKGRSPMDLSFPSPAAHYPYLPHPPMWPAHVGLPPAAFWPPFPPPPYPAFPPPAPSATPLPHMHPHAARMHPMHAAPPMHAHAMPTPAMAPHHALLPPAPHPAHCHIPTPMGPTHMHTDMHTPTHMRSSSLSSGRASVRRDLGVQSMSSNSNTALPTTSINTSSNNNRSNNYNGDSKSKNGSKNVTGSNGFPSSSNCNIPISSTSNSGMGSGGLRESSSPIPSSFLEEVSSMFCDPLPFH